MLPLRKGICLSLLTLCAWAYAGIMGQSCQGESVSIPCNELGYDFIGRALYVQVTGSDAGEVKRSNSSNLNPVSFGANPGWGFAFQLETAFHFSSANDINLNWYHYRGEASHSSEPGRYEHMVLSSPFIANPLTTDMLLVKKASTTLNPEWDQANAEFGKHVLLGQYDDLRVHGGVNYSRLANSGAIQFIGQSDLNTYDNTETLSSVYNGFGLRLGLDLRHDWNNGLVFYANAAGSLLAGTAKSSQQFVDVINGVSYQGVESSNAARVIPEIDGRLGASFTYEMVQGDLVLDAGWLWANYFNVLGISQADYGIQGAYFGLKWLSHLA